jgi:ureidoacrylate peracid hydrolase
MHQYEMPQFARDRILRRQGRFITHDELVGRKTALIVVDMQNYFVADGFAARVPVARECVPQINEAAKALRAVGGTVVWVQTTAVGALETWNNFHTHMMVPERRHNRLTQLGEDHEGFKLFPLLGPESEDLRVKKVKFSAFIQGASELDKTLRSRGVENLLVAGTLTNVCCEATARDAMMLDYRVVMLSDANAALTDEEHANSLTNIAIYFGDVMSTADAVSRFRR